MTLIELYDRAPLLNIFGILALRPSKVLIVGYDDKTVDTARTVREMLDAKHLCATVETRVVDPSDTQATRYAFEKIAQTERDCVLDVTGGDERLINAAVSVAEQYGWQSQHFDVHTGIVTDTDGDGNRVPHDDVSLTVRDWITLHGGVVTGCTAIPSCTVEETNRFWDLARRRPREWNDRIKLLTTLEKGHHVNGTVSFAKQDIYKSARERFEDILSTLEHHGIIQRDDNESTIRYRYTKPYFRSFLKKAGNLLEHKAFYEAIATVYNERPLFSDACIGVSIDWTEKTIGDSKITNNEIDLLTMCGVQPLFVSCKNGDVDENELYKLETVATRFGGTIAKTMLIVTELEPDSPQAREALIRRAADMGIHLVANAGRLSSDEWQEEFKKAMDIE